MQSSGLRKVYLQLVLISSMSSRVGKDSSMSRMGVTTFIMVHSASVFCFLKKSVSIWIPLFSLKGPKQFMTKFYTWTGSETTNLKNDVASKYIPSLFRSSLLTSKLNRFLKQRLEQHLKLTGYLADKNVPSRTHSLPVFSDSLIFSLCLKKKKKTPFPNHINEIQ